MLYAGQSVSEPRTDIGNGRMRGIAHDALRVEGIGQLSIEVCHSRPLALAQIADHLD